MKELRPLGKYIRPRQKPRRIKPRQDVWVQGFRNTHDYNDFYNYVKETYLHHQWLGHAFPIYARHPHSGSKLGWRWVKTYVSSFEVLRYLHHKGLIDIDEIKSNALTYHRNKYPDKDWYRRLGKLKPSTRKIILKEHMPAIIDTIHKKGRDEDAKIGKILNEMLAVERL